MRVSKWMKKTAAVVMTAAMALSLVAGIGVKVKAETTDEVIKVDKTGSITIYVSDSDGGTPIVGTGNNLTGDQRNNLGTPINDVEFAYKKVATIKNVVDGTDNTVSMMYEITDELKTLLGETGTNLYTSNDLNSKLAAANISATSCGSWNTITTGKDGATASSGTGTIKGKASVSGLELGLYLVVEKSHPANVTKTIAPFFVSVPMTDSISGETNKWNYDVVVYPKSQTTDTVNLEKTVADVTSEETVSYGKTATASGGDTLSYHLDSNLPEITQSANSTYIKEFGLEDTLAKGLSYNKDSVQIEFYETAASTSPKATWKLADDKFTAVFDDAKNKMTITLTDAGLSEINPAYSMYKMRVSYNCTVNCGNDKSTVYGNKGNENSATLSFRRASEVTLNSDPHTATDSTRVYSYGLDLKKNFAGDAGDYSKVQFTLKNTKDKYNITATGSEGVYYVTECDKTADATKLVPNNQGKLIVYGLEADTYELTEVQTDKGYSLLKQPMTIVISTEEEMEDTKKVLKPTATVQASDNQDAVSVDMKDFGEGEDASKSALVPVTVTNTKAFTLPETGGMGTILFTVIGAVVFAAAAIFLVKGKKKEEIEK